MLRMCATPLVLLLTYLVCNMILVSMFLCYVVCLLGSYISLHVLGLGFYYCAVSTMVARFIALTLLVVHWQAYDDYVL